MWMPRSEAWGIIHVIDGQPRLWGTPELGEDSFDVESSGVPERASAADVDITADGRGFTVTNAAGADLTVLVTLIARATGPDADAARAHLVALTSNESWDGPLRVTPRGDPAAYSRLWHEPIAVRRSTTKEWVATRAGGLVIALPGGASFRFAPQSSRHPRGIVVAAVAALSAGLGIGAHLAPVDRGAHASLGEAPEPAAR